MRVVTLGYLVNSQYGGGAIRCSGDEDELVFALGCVHQWN